MAGSGAPVVELRPFAPVYEVLVEFRKHKTLEHRSALGSVEKFLHRADLKQITQKACAQEVEL